MKRIIAISILLCGLTSGFAQTMVNNKVASPIINIENAVFNWSETTFDFGKIKSNVPATHEFTFVNKGDVPLVITSVQTSCGCTVTEYSKDPIATGQYGFVKATYNAAKPGTFTRTVTINSNTDESAVILTIKGEVVVE